MGWKTNIIETKNYEIILLNGLKINDKKRGDGGIRTSDLSNCIQCLNH